MLGKQIYITPHPTFQNGLEQRQFGKDLETEYIKNVCTKLTVRCSACKVGISNITGTYWASDNDYNTCSGEEIYTYEDEKTKDSENKQAEQSDESTKKSAKIQKKSDNSVTESTISTERVKSEEPGSKQGE